MPTLSHSQRVALALLPKITGWSSLIFSSFLAAHVLRDADRRRSCYSRLMLGVSLADISTSFWHGMSTWPIPAGEQLWSVGNDQTCRLQGFFTQNSIISSFYNASLSIYFWLVIVRGWKEEELRKVELIFHVIPLTFGLTTAVAGLALDVLGDAFLWCWVGGEHVVFRWVAYYVPLWTMIFIVTACCISIYSRVRKLERAVEERNSNQSTDVDDDNDEHRVHFSPEYDKDSSDDEQVAAQPSDINAVDNAAENGGSNAEARQPRRVRQVAEQCFLYAAAFYVNWSSLTAVRLIQTFGGQVPVFLMIISAVTVPIQGLPNFLVYLRPKFQKARRRNPKETWYKSFARSAVPLGRSVDVSMSRRHSTLGENASELVDLERVNEVTNEDEDAE